MSVKECVKKILEEQPHLTNEEIAEKCRSICNSKTTAKNIAWYKWKFSTAEVPFDVTDDEIEEAQSITEQLDEDDEVENWSYAEEFVRNYEEKKGCLVKRISTDITPGYDIISIYPDGEERFIEVKSKKKGKLSWLTLTSNETTALLNEPKFWLYLVEGDISKSEGNIVEVSRSELLKAVKIKLHGRVSNLSRYTRINHQINTSNNGNT